MIGDRPIPAGLRRLAAGHYVTADGRFEIHQISRNRWDVLRADGTTAHLGAATLRECADFLGEPMPPRGKGLLALLLAVAVALGVYLALDHLDEAHGHPPAPPVTYIVGPPGDDVEVRP